MKVRTLARRAVSTLAAAGVAVSVLAVGAPPATADSSAKLFLGAGRGLTADVAIQGAIWDAEASAGAEQLFTCALVGEPTVFESTDDPTFGHVFRAMVELSCTP